MRGPHPRRCPSAMRSVRAAPRGTAHDGAMSPAPDAAVDAPAGDDRATATGAPTGAPTGPANAGPANAGPAIDAAAVDAAAARLEGVVTRTPLERSERLSDRTGAEVWLKREDLQVVRSYKLRGAYNLMAQLDPGARAAGVVCASAGNHGQGLAYACRLLDLHGVVFLPRTTPRQKRDRIAHLGGGAVEVVVVGDTYDEAAAAAYDHAATTGATLVPAFDDLRT